jgi:hypothetical protein
VIETIDLVDTDSDQEHDPDAETVLEARKPLAAAGPSRY